MHDERGELRGLLIVLGLVCALGAVVFGFGLRAHRSPTTAAKVAAGVTTSSTPDAPTTSVPGDPAAPTASPVASSSAAAAPSPAPTTAARTAAPPVTSPPATAPPSSSPPATSPPATTPRTTVVPFSCTFSLSDTNPASGAKVTLTIQANYPNRQFLLDRYVNGQLRSAGNGSATRTDGSSRYTATFSVTERSGDQVRLVAHSDGSCEADYTVR